MTRLPTGTITFLFSDIEGSTRLLNELGPPRFKETLEHHQSLVRDALAVHGGVEIATEGDSFFCVFDTAPSGIAAAVDIQRSLAGAEWPEGVSLRVRIGLHTGTAAIGGDNYVGIDVHRAARIGETGHGGQVVVSAVTRLLGEPDLPDGVSFIDLREVHLRDLEQPEHLYQLVIEGVESTFPPLRKLQRGPTNISISTSGFVGRDRERIEVEKLLDESRLVTITGLAGAGKSRLALEVAANARERFSEGVWLIELASTASDDLVAQTAAHALGLQESAGRPAQDVLTDYLRDGKRLLVFDNCEDILDGVRDLVGHLIDSSRDLAMLTTSRQVLGAGGETRYQCPPLATPPVSASATADIAAFEAVTLFELRAREVDSSFTVSDANAEIVAAICRRLDGMPLAIELAAPLVQILTPQQILERLDDRFELLRGGPRDAPQHQRSLSAALESTFGLLNESRQEFAMRLGVFVGDFDIAAAEAVTTGGDISRGDVVDALSALADRSLISSMPTEAGLRLTILESVRQFLKGKLKASGRLRVRQIAHSRHYESLVAEASSALRGPGQDTWSARLDADIENIRAAIEFAAETGDESALDMSNRLFLYWRRRGDWSDGLHSTRVAIEGTSKRDSGLRARMLATAGFFASDLGEGVQGLADMEEGFAMARRVGDLHAEGYCSSFLGAELSRRDTDLDRGLELLSQASRIYNELGEPYGEAWVNRYLALSYQERGDLDRAIELQTASLEAFEQALDTWNIRFTQTLLAESMHTIGELIRARELYDESLRGSGGAQYKVVSAQAHKGLGKVALAEGKLDEAFDYLQEALRELREIGDVAARAETAGHLAMVNLGRGRTAAAAELLVESLRTFFGMRDKGGVAWSLERLAAAAAAGEDLERAAMLLEAASAIRERSGSIRALVDQPDIDRLTGAITDAIGQDRYQAAAAGGAALDLDGAVALGTALPPGKG